jgi:hypothetical protein
VRTGVEQQLHLPASSEERDGFPFNRNQSPCARIPSGSACAKLCKKHSKPPQLDPITACHCGGNLCKNGVDDLLGVLRRRLSNNSLVSRLSRLAIRGDVVSPVGLVEMDGRDRSRPSWSGGNVQERATTGGRWASAKEILNQTVYFAANALETTSRWRWGGRHLGLHGHLVCGFGHDSTFHDYAIGSSYIDLESRYPLAKCGEVSSVGPEAELVAKFPFSSPPTSAKSVPFPFIKWRCLDGQKIKASGVVSDRCAHLENRRQEEDTGGKHCPNVEADRGGYASKGI